MPINHSKNLLPAGTLLEDKWVIMDLLGKGAFGEVYRAHQLNLKRDVAIKILSPEMLALFEENAEEIENTLHRFQREVQSMAQVRHPNILQIIDHGATTIEKDGKRIDIEFIVMEYIPGATLRFSMSDEGYGDEADLIYPWLKDYFLPLLNGVEAIHAAGIVHRDIKPENVLLDGKIPKIADFGLARSQAIRPITNSMDMKGTLMYMAPEQFIDFRKSDHQADIYSLGKILFEAISGTIGKETLPFKQVALTDPESPFLKGLDRIVRKATHEDKQKRFQSILELRSAVAAALETYEQAGEAPADTTARPRPGFQNPKWVWTGIILVLVAVLGMALWHLFGDPGRSSTPKEKAQTFQNGTQTSISDAVSDQKSGSTPRPNVLLGTDGIEMQLFFGGPFSFNPGTSIDQEQTLDIEPFYMDAVMITNHHFIEFLNAVSDTLVVEENVVKQNGQIWLYLGQEDESSSQIVFQHTRFHIKDPGKSALPVIRVTGYGALAYARYNGKRLPTEAERRYAARQKRLQTPNAPEPGKNTEGHLPSGKDESGHHMMDVNTSSQSHGKSSVEPKMRGGSLKEWVMSRTTSQKIFVLDTSARLGYSKVVSRHLWEAFDDVGFRCAKSVSL